MSDESERKAAVDAALPYVQSGMTLGLGSGRAVFALTDLIGTREDAHTFTVVAASGATEEHAHAAGLKVVDLQDVSQIDLALDGADEVDPQLRLIKGGGAALLREKLLLSAADQRVIFCQQRKLVERLGETRTLPVEVVTFGWTWTAKRLLTMTDSVELRREPDGSPVATAEHDFLLDIAVPEGDIDDFAHALTDALGVVDHGLFLTEADIVLLGNDDGSSTTLTR